MTCRYSAYWCEEGPPHERITRHHGPPVVFEVVLMDRPRHDLCRCGPEWPGDHPCRCTCHPRRKGRKVPGRGYQLRQYVRPRRAEL